jgi:hypothetical protein
MTRPSSALSRFSSSAKENRCAKALGKPLMT